MTAVELSPSGRPALGRSMASAIIDKMKEQSSARRILPVQQVP